MEHELPWSSRVKWMSARWVSAVVVTEKPGSRQEDAAWAQREAGTAGTCRAPGGAHAKLITESVAKIRGQ